MNSTDERTRDYQACLKVARKKDITMTQAADLMGLRLIQNDFCNNCTLFQTECDGSYNPIMCGCIHRIPKEIRTEWDRMILERKPVEART